MKAVAELSVCPLLSVLSRQQVSQFLQSYAKKPKWCICGLTMDRYLIFVHIFMKFVNSSSCALSLHKGNVITWRKHTKQIQSLEAEVLCSPVALGAQQYSRVSLLLRVCLHVPLGAFDFWTWSRQCAEIQSHPEHSLWLLTKAGGWCALGLSWDVSPCFLTVMLAVTS